MELWIARDAYDSLWLYDDEPVKSKKGDWFISKKESRVLTDLPIDMFPEVTFENSPRKVKIELV